MYKMYTMVLYLSPPCYPKSNSRSMAAYYQLLLLQNLRGQSDERFRYIVQVSYNRPVVVSQYYLYFIGTTILLSILFKFDKNIYRINYTIVSGKWHLDVHGTILNVIL